MMISPLLEQVLCINSFRHFGEKPKVFPESFLKNNENQYPRSIFWHGKLCFRLTPFPSTPAMCLRPLSALRVKENLVSNNFFL